MIEKETLMHRLNFTFSYFTLSNQAMKCIWLGVLAGTLTACATSGPDIPRAKKNGQPILITNLDTYLTNPNLITVTERVKLEEVKQRLGYREEDKNSDAQMDAKAVNESEDMVESESQNKVVGLYIRFINLQDQAIEKIEFTFKAYDDKQGVIQLAETDGLVGAQANAVTQDSIGALNSEDANAAEEADSQQEISANQVSKGAEVSTYKLTDGKGIEGTLTQKKLEGQKSKFTARVNTDQNTLIIGTQELIQSEAFNALNYGSFVGVSGNVEINCVSLEGVSITTAGGTTQDYDSGELVSSSQVPRCEPSPVD